MKRKQEFMFVLHPSMYSATQHYTSETTSTDTINRRHGPAQNNPSAARSHCKPKHATWMAHVTRLWLACSLRAVSEAAGPSTSRMQGSS